VSHRHIGHLGDFKVGQMDDPFVGQVEEPAENNGLPVCLFVPSQPVVVTVGLKKAWRSISLAFLAASGPV